MFALGYDLNPQNFNLGATVQVVLDGGTTTSYSLPASDVNGFRGFVSDVPFTTFRVTTGGLAWHGIDNLEAYQPLDILDVSPDPRGTAVGFIDVNVALDIVGNTFDHNDVTLTRNGGANLITSGVSVSYVSGKTYRVSGLSSLTTEEGFYSLTINGAGIARTNGANLVGSAVENWEFDLTPGYSRWNADGDATDASGPNDGTGTAIAYAAGLSGQAFSFDGVNNSVTVKRQIQNDFTIAAWMKSSTTSRTGSQFYQGNALITAEVSGTTNDFGTSILNNKFVFGTGNPDTTIQSMTTVTTGEWMHIAAVRSGDTIKVYVNGVLEATQATGNSGALTAPSVITFGGYSTASSQRYNGLLDDVQVFARALSDSEIVDVYSVLGRQNTAPLPPVDENIAENAVPEGAVAGALVGITASALDAEGDTLTYSLTDDAGGRFVIDPASGVVSVAEFASSLLDYEVAGSFLITVQAEDPDGLTSTADFTINVTDVTELNGIDMQLGQTQRSLVRYLDVVFDRPDDLMDLINNGRLQLTKRDLNGNSPAVMSFPMPTVSGNSIRLDFGAQGIGGNRTSNVGDRYYEIAVDMDGDGSFESKKYFHRLLGDVTGNGIVDNADKAQVLAAQGVAYSVESDVNGDGVVNVADTLLVTRAVGRKLKDSLFPLDD